MENDIRTNHFLEEDRKKALSIERPVQYTVEEKHNLEIVFTTQKLRDIKNVLIKVTDANDFVEIICEIMQMKRSSDVSKEWVNEMKSKWKQYKITKKQIVSIFELL